MSKLTDYSKFDLLTEDSSDDDDDDDDENAAEEIARKCLTTTAAAAASPSHAATPVSSHTSIRSSNNKNGEAIQPPIGGSILRDKTSGRYRFEYNGRTIYEFEQNLDEMTIYILPPPYVTKGNQINCIISANHFKLGLVGHSTTSDGNDKQTQWFLNEATYGTVDVDESTWTLEDYDGDDDGKNKNKSRVARRKIIVVTLIKANRGTVWEAALKGNPNGAARGGKAGTIHTKTAATTMDPVSKEQIKKDLMLQRFQEENPGFDFSGADFNGSVPDARKFMGGIKYE